MKKIIISLFFIAVCSCVLYANQFEGAWIGEDGATWIFYENGTIVRFRIIDSFDAFWPADKAVELRKQQSIPPLMLLEEYRGTFTYNSDRINIHFTRSYHNFFNGGGMTGREDKSYIFEYRISDDILFMNEIISGNISNSTLTKSYSRAFYTTRFNGEWYKDRKKRLEFSDDNLMMFSETGNSLYNGKYFMNHKYICLYFPSSFQLPGGTISTVNNCSIYEYQYSNNILALRHLSSSNEMFEEYIR
jgi:hypothetical protein